MKHYEKCWCGSDKKYKNCHMVIDSCHSEAIIMYNEMIEKENREFKRNILDSEESIMIKYNSVDQEKRDYWKEFSINELLEANIIDEKESDIFCNYSRLIKFRNEKIKAEKAKQKLALMLGAIGYTNDIFNC